MNYLKDSFELAQNRNYLQYPEVRNLIDNVPNWFRLLGTENGRSQFESKYKKKFPAALREFYECLPLACFLEATIDGNVFFNEFEEDELPLMVNWSNILHLAFAFHGHSGSVCAVRLDEDDPVVYWGFDDEPEHIPYSKINVPFSKWILDCVESYDKRLNDWLDDYKKLKGNPAEERRRGNPSEWIRKMPGMAERLKKVNL
jgi:hypothetical protein